MVFFFFLMLKSLPVLWTWGWPEGQASSITRLLTEMKPPSSKGVAKIWTKVMNSGVYTLYRCNFPSSKAHESIGPLPCFAVCNKLRKVERWSQPCLFSGVLSHPLVSSGNYSKTPLVTKLHRCSFPKNCLYAAHYIRPPKCRVLGRLLIITNTQQTCCKGSLYRAL